MCSSFGCWELSQVIFLKLAEKERTEQTHKMTTIFTQNCPRLSFLSEWMCSALIMSKITWLDSQQPKTRAHVEHLFGWYCSRLMHDKSKFYLQQKMMPKTYLKILTVYWVISYSLQQKYHFRSYTIRLLLHTITKRGQNDIRDMCNYSKARLDTTPKS